MSHRSQNALYRLAQAYGLEPVYVDETGVRKVTPLKSLRRILALLGARTGSVKEIRQSLIAARLRSWLTFVDAVMVVRQRALPKTWTVRIPIGSLPLSRLAVKWMLIDESGAGRTRSLSGNRLQVVARKRIQGVRHVKLALPFPRDIQNGYYRVEVSAVAAARRWDGRMTLIVTPNRCFLPQEGEAQAGGSAVHRMKNPGRGWRGAEHGKRLWGITIQLYGLRSHQNWGIGDFRDLRNFIVWAGGELGAAMVGVNPLHALPPDGISPYSPSSRLFHNPLYLDVEGIAEFQERPVFSRWVRRPAVQRKLKELRSSATIDYPAVRSLKWLFFERLYRVFRASHLQRGTDRGEAFYRFVQEQGESLDRFALFQVLQEHLARESAAGGVTGWRDWPLQFRHPASPAVRKFRSEHEDRVNFFKYLEWQCDLQLKDVQAAAARVGMPIGLYQDLAVGIDPNGADAWSFQDQLVDGASIGAPPDLFSPRGQNWGLAPLHPIRLRAHAYQVFIDCVRQTMRHGGLLRIDHAMGLFRLFWIPKSSSPADGGYVTYPAQDLLGILALESNRSKTMLVGEDLGTVTSEIRAGLMQAGLLSCRLLLFEKTRSGAFLPPHRYPAQALASFSTHDLPTLRGFWIGHDIALKERLGLYPNAQGSARDRETRRRDRQALLNALHREGLLPPGYPHDAEAVIEPDETLIRAICAYVARTSCRLVVVSLEDLLGDIEMPNLPNALPEAYPIWRRKTGPGTELEQWRRDPHVQAMVETLRRERSRSR